MVRGLVLAASFVLWLLTCLRVEPARAELSTQMGQACPPFIDGEYTGKEAQLISSLKTEQESKHHCEAAAIAYQLRQKASDKKKYVQFAQLTVTELLAAGDYRATVVLGLKALSDEKIPTSAHEPFRILILRSLFLACRELGHEKDMTWARYGLGLMSYADSRGEALVFESFLREFPQSVHTAEVVRMKSEILDLYLRYELGVVGPLLARDKYMAVIHRLEWLYRKESFDLFSQSTLFPEILTQAVRAQTLFAEDIRHQPWIPVWYKWSDERLRHVFNIEPGESVDRNSLADLLEGKARNVCKFLLENYSLSPKDCRF